MAATATIATLPAEIILELPQHLESIHDLAALARTSARLHSLLNAELYRRDVASGLPVAPYWAAETGQLATIRHSHAAGARLDRPWYSHRPRYKFDGDGNGDGDGEGDGSGAATSPYRPTVAVPTTTPGPSTARSFLDLLTSVPFTPATDLPPSLRYFFYECWWHVLDLAAYHGHGDVVRFVADALDDDALAAQLHREESSCGLCAHCPLEVDISAIVAAGLGGSRGLPSTTRRAGAGLHSAATLATCAGHADVAALLSPEALGRSGENWRRAQERAADPEGRDASKEEVQKRNLSHAPAAFAYRDFVLEGF
ncbi:hypothetical protein B0T26DRAFT_781929 [Lasiosphaeria miniovina]|uniref:F-box domain-containing protein n=1 Tax=Lasiosphaeria miniovina TaxID=1954250 RepID=A0AA40DRX1_9PEZI|nr:uncharacterized protein B0T26DRAFT_781929 [Lasiosphaeria miniovina]KAK0713300.1 hypothetical protein B0T26DRAFT_781929 [Lasiosphaeria miniovina]